jgi:serine/threonine-protein kinase
VENTRWGQAQSLFHQAAALPEAEWQEFLGAACGDDQGLYAEVLAMLKADAGGQSVLDDGLPSIAERFIGGRSEFDAVRAIGPYKLVRILGEGGMGVVWLAEREDTGQRVAVKLLLGAGFSPARRERFTREIKTLAKLKHPYIARLYDAGTLADGTPWFAMEYVEGKCLTDYARERGLRLDEVLRLFRQICEAVQYAHSQEIIHRDLKPSNILVEQDGTPRLLDFGIARELQGMDDAWEKTRAGLRFLSPHYAAPEWAREGTVGFFTDVYSLGVILYELLARRLPLERSAQTADAEFGASRLSPEKPSAIAAAAFPLSKGAWSDLDVLCLKALRSDPKERYASVEALLRDLNHYVRNEPLEAQTDSFRYRLGKFVRRNLRPVFAATATFALIAGLTVFFTLRLAKERDRALAESARKERIQQFMTDLFQGGDAEAAPPEDLRVLTLLDRGVQKAESLKSEPLIQADLYRTLGGIYDQLGRYDKADSLFVAALKADRSAPHPDEMAISDDLLDLGLLRSDEEKPREAEPLVREGLEIIERHRPLDAKRQADAVSALGRVLAEGGRQKEGAIVLKRAILLQSKHDAASIQLSDTIGLLANAEMYLGHYSESEALNRRALEVDRKIYGNNHPNVAMDLINLGQLESQLGRDAEAEQYDRQAVAITKAWYGPNHPDSARQSAILGEVLVREGRNDEAQALLNYAFETEKRFYPATDSHLAFVLNALGLLAENRGQFAAATDHFRQVISIYRATYGDGDYRVGVGISNLGEVYLLAKEHAEAERLLRQAIDLWIKVLPEDDIRIGIAQVRLGRAIAGQHRYEEALAHSLAGYEILQKQTGPETSDARSARQDIAAIYMALNQPGKAKKYQLGSG